AVSAVAAPAAPGSQRWVTRFGTRFLDTAYAVRVSPDGSRVYVAGFTGGSQGNDAIATVAYDEATGTQVWNALHPGGSGAAANALTVSPDGAAVYVTGSSASPANGTDNTTIAYDAATGSQRWLSDYNGPGNGDDSARAITTSADGTKVYVTGVSFNPASDD